MKSHPQVHVGLERTIEIEEIKEIRSAVYGGYAAMQMPASFLLQAIKAHERHHVKQIREGHFNVPSFTGSPTLQAKKVKTSTMLSDFAQKYIETLEERIGNECQVLEKFVYAEIGKLKMVKITPFKLIFLCLLKNLNYSFDIRFRITNRIDGKRLANPNYLTRRNHKEMF